MGKAFQHPVLTPPRFSLGPLRSGGVAACLWLWTASGVTAAPAANTGAAPLPASAYWQAMDRFNHADYTRALDLLEHAPDAGKPGEQADVWNLRGAAYLHLHKYDQARTAVSKAVERTPTWGRRTSTWPRSASARAGTRTAAGSSRLCSGAPTASPTRTNAASSSTS